jgi:cytochrome c
MALSASLASNLQHRPEEISMSHRIRVLFSVIGLAALSSAYAPANAANGDANRCEELYQECVGCHELRENAVGPKHCGVFQRRAGIVPGYNYSAALGASGIVWDRQHLNDFLKSPFTYVNGTNIGYAGIDDEKDRFDLIAYLQWLSIDSELCRETK